MSRRSVLALASVIAVASGITLGTLMPSVLNCPNWPMVLGAISVASLGSVAAFLALLLLNSPDI